MTFYRRIEARQKRGTFPFKTLFHSSRYDFRFSRYRRVKESVILNRLLSSFLPSRSHLVSLTHLKL